MYFTCQTYVAEKEVSVPHYIGASIFTSEFSIVAGLIVEMLF